VETAVRAVFAVHFLSRKWTQMLDIENAYFGPHDPNCNSTTGDDGTPPIVLVSRGCFPEKHGEAPNK